MVWVRSSSYAFYGMFVFNYVLSSFFYDYFFICLALFHYFYSQLYMYIRV